MNSRLCILTLETRRYLEVVEKEMRNKLKGKGL